MGWTTCCPTTSRTCSTWPSIASRAASARDMSRPRRRARFSSPRGRSRSRPARTLRQPDRPRVLPRHRTARGGPSIDVDPGRGRQRTNRTPPSAVAEIVDVLREAGVLESQPRALLGGSHDEASRLARLEAQMRFALDRDAAVYSAEVRGARVSREYHRGWMLDSGAAVYGPGSVGCGGRHLQPRPRELARGCGEGFLLDHDLVSVFQVGWRVLYTDVCMFAAEHLDWHPGRLQMSRPGDSVGTQRPARRSVEAMARRDAVARPRRDGCHRDPRPARVGRAPGARRRMPRRARRPGGGAFQAAFDRPDGLRVHLGQHADRRRACLHGGASRRCCGVRQRPGHSIRGRLRYFGAVKTRSARAKCWRQSGTTVAKVGPTP